MIDSNRMRRQRWLIFSVLALMYILVYFYRVSMAVVARDIARDLELTPQQLGSLSGILFFVYALAQLPLGPMIDRLGSRVVISGCGVLTACGGIMFSQAGSLATAMAARVLIGIGTASVLMATFTVFSHWYTKQEFGRVSGFMVAVGNVGNLSATAPLALLVAAIGWRTSFLAIGVLQALVTVLVFWKVQDRPPGTGADDAGHPDARPDMMTAWREIFGNRDFWLLGMLAFFWYGNYLALQGLWGGPYLVEVLHLSSTATGRLLMATALGFIAGSMVIDSIARRLFHSYKRTLLAGQALLLALMCSFLGPAEKMALPLLAAVFFAIGMAVSSGVMVYPIIRSMFSVRITGTALTSLNFFVLMGSAVSQLVMGLIIGALKRDPALSVPAAFHGAFLFPIIGLAITIVMYFFARDYWEKP
ncbi:MAG: MFS transporter [Geobacteraceae bacterium]|nr:MFS transporter [Geobacteraceae bacterium]